MMQELSYHTGSQHWIFRYKLHHIPFWFLYNYILWAVAIGNPLKAASSVFTVPFGMKFLFYVVFQTVAVYFNLYFLIPRLLEKGRFAAYIGCLLLTILAASFLIVPGYYVSAYLAGKTVEQQWGPGACWYSLLANPVPTTAASITLAMSIKLTKNWVQAERKKQLLENEKLETELKFLKYQINPHFLFNSINSIFFLIHKNPDMASSSLAKFSELLRYQLYECNDTQIPLGKEIGYLENFIELERLRQNHNVEVSFQLNPSCSDHLGIAPFILMTFVENAFKHVSKHADRSNWIRIKLDLDGQRLELALSNSTAHSAPNDVVSYGGIGLKNVQRRLDLIYPGQHELDIESGPDRFEVRLRLMLGELEVGQSGVGMPGAAAGVGAGAGATGTRAAMQKAG
jgi:two-component system LytT family sensor kinase